MGCCKSLSTKYLQLANLLIGLAGALALGFGIYLWVDLGDLASGAFEFTVIGPVVVGVFLLLVTIIGFCAVKKHNKCLLFIYFFLVFIMTALVGAAGFIGLMYTGYLPDLGLGLETYLASFEGTIYNTCCVDAGFTADEVPLCSAPGAGVNGTRCITNIITLPPTVCDYLEDLALPLGSTTLPTVGNVTTGGCGNGGGSDAFFDQLSSYINSNLYLLGGVEVGLFTVLLLVLLSSCALFCSKKDEFNPQQGNKPVTGYQTTGGNLA